MSKCVLLTLTHWCTPVPFVLHTGLACVCWCLSKHQWMLAMIHWIICKALCISCLSVSFICLFCLAKWMNDVNCDTVMIILIELARASWMTTTGWYPSPLLNPNGWWCGGFMCWLGLRWPWQHYDAVKGSSPLCGCCYDSLMLSGWSMSGLPIAFDVENKIDN